MVIVALNSGIMFYFSVRRIRAWQFLSTVMPRPRNCSYRSHQLIYARLLKDPLWLGDWRSTGLKSRSTVHNRLKYLVSKGLVLRTRQKHKILYSIVTPKVFTAQFYWADVLYKVSRKEARSYKRSLRLVGKSFDNITALLESPEAQELLAVLRENDVDVDQLPVWPSVSKWMRELLFPHLNGQLCLECLRQGKVVNFVTDPQTGEIICPLEGIVRTDSLNLE